jgi:hypothetical protein
MPVKIIGPTPDQFTRVIINVFDKSAIHMRKEWAPLIADTLALRLRQVIFEQLFDLEPLKPEYKEWKAQHGYDTRILIQTDEYVRSIRWWQLPSGDTVVGVPNKIHHSGLPMRILARVHEFGSAKANIPARPVWRPVLSSFIRNFDTVWMARLTKAYANAIKNAFRLEWHYQ